MQVTAEIIHKTPTAKTIALVCWHYKWAADEEKQNNNKATKSALTLTRKKKNNGHTLLNEREIVQQEHSAFAVWQ